jgi:uncharacterized protein DUF6650
MNFSEIGQRINGIGISTPIFGFSVNWNPPESAKHIAREVIIYLENRRVLYDPYNVQLAAYCVPSVIEMRQVLTDQITASSSDADLEKNLRAMRGACRTFLEKVVIPPAVSHPSHGFSDPKDPLVLIGALAELRATFGLYIGILAAKYGIDIEEDLASILPSSDKQDE